MDRETGAPLSGWPAVLQSIAVILTTPLGSRVMRRDFGSELADLIDRPMSSEVILAIYAASAGAIARWEPRFRLTGIRLTSGGAPGQVRLELRGEHDGRVVTGEVALA